MIEFRAQKSLEAGTIKIYSTVWPLGSGKTISFFLDVALCNKVVDMLLDQVTFCARQHMQFVYTLSDSVKVQRCRSFLENLHDQVLEKSLSDIFVKVNDERNACGSNFVHVVERLMERNQIVQGRIEQRLITF